MTRRTNGQGSEPWWNATAKRFEGKIEIGGRRRSVSGKTKKAVNDRYDILKAEAASGAPVADKSMTVAHLAGKWKTRVFDARTVAETTQDKTERYLRMIDQEIGRKMLAKLTTDHVETMLDELVRGRDKPYSKDYVSKLRATLREVLDFGVARNYVQRNVASVAELPASCVGAKETKSLSEDEAVRFLNALDGEPLELLFTIALTCGLRPGEAAGLVWSSIDLDAGTVTIDHGVAVTRTGRAVLKDTVKTRGGERTVRLTDDVLTRLEAHRCEQVRERAASSVWENDDIVFPSPRIPGAPMNPSYVRDAMRRLAKRADLNGLTPNGLRHTAANILIDNGVPLERVSDILGHSDLRMVTMVYRHRNRGVLDAGVAPMSALLERARAIA